VRLLQYGIRLSRKLSGEKPEVQRLSPTNGKSYGISAPTPTMPSLYHSTSHSRSGRVCTICNGIAGLADLATAQDNRHRH
jgi:hypothetical protein